MRMAVGKCRSSVLGSAQRILEGLCGVGVWCLPKCRDTEPRRSSYRHLTTTGPQMHEIDRRSGSTQRAGCKKVVVAECIAAPERPVWDPPPTARQGRAYHQVWMLDRASNARAIKADSYVEITEG